MHRTTRRPDPATPRFTTGQVAQFAGVQPRTLLRWAALPWLPTPVKVDGRGGPHGYHHLFSENDARQFEVVGKLTRIGFDIRALSQYDAMMRVALLRRIEEMLSREQAAA